MAGNVNGMFLLRKGGRSFLAAERNILLRAARQGQLPQGGKSLHVKLPIGEGVDGMLAGREVLVAGEVLVEIEDIAAADFIANFGLRLDSDGIAVQAIEGA